MSHTENHARPLNEPFGQVATAQCMNTLPPTQDSISLLRYRRTYRSKYRQNFYLCRPSAGLCAPATRHPRRCWRIAAEERVLSARTVSTAIHLGDFSGKVLRTRRLDSRGALALSSTSESAWPSDSRFLMATFLIYFLKPSRIVWLISAVL